MIKKHKLPLVLFSIILILSTLGFFLGNNVYKQFFSPQEKVPYTEPIVKEEQIIECSPTDEKCLARNKKIKIGKISGVSVEFAKHQCDGPRACPTPNPEQANEAISAVRKEAEDKKLELIRITGINAAGVIYYCAQEGRCWSYNTKSKEVEQLINNSPTPKTSPTSLP